MSAKNEKTLTYELLLKNRVSSRRDAQSRGKAAHLERPACSFDTVGAILSPCEEKSKNYTESVEL